MESITVITYVFSFLIIGVILFYTYRLGRDIWRNKKVFRKSPRVTGRNILVHPAFGSAYAVGGTMIGIDKTNILMSLVDTGHAIALPFNNQQLVPEHSVNSFLGTNHIWRVKGVYYPDGFVEKAKAELEAQNMELSHEAVRQKLIKKTEVYEAATLKDTVMDIVKEMREQKQGEVIIKK